MELTGRTVATLACLVCMTATMWACGSRSAPPTTPVATQPSRPASAPLIDECALIAAAGEPVATVALTERAEAANAPRPTNESERLVFRQVYETLLRIDCMGRPLPGLAASWRLDGDGRTWIVTLRDEARFTDGTPVTAADVRASWTTRGTEDLRPSASRLAESVVPISDRTLAIRLRSRRTDLPASLAHTDLAVAKPIPGSPWPAGTRDARIASAGSAPADSAIGVSRDNQPPLRFVVATGDPRDPLDRGAELLLTRDPATLRYAASLPQFEAVPLSWQRTYVLVTPGRSRTAPPLSESARQALATDAIRGDAKGASGPFWWQMPTDCEVGRAALPVQPAPTPRIVYETGDEAARDLAERLVGLARASGPAATPLLETLLPERPRRTYERAVGLAGDALAVARRRGTDAGYIVAVANNPIAPCRDLQVVADVIPWLDPETIVPLVDTRLHAIVRRGRSGISAESDGGLVIAGVNGRH